MQKPIKKTAAVLISSLFVVFSFTACSKENETMPQTQSSTENTSANDSSDISNQPSDLIDNVQAGANINPHAVTGEYTGTDKTFTGFEPLPEVSFSVSDEVTRSNNKIGYSYGVAKDGVPHQNSVTAQEKFKEYGAIALDTVCESNNIYLTFDCGYENGYTSKILDTLKEKEVTAAFFVTLDYIKSNPEIVKRMILEGHIVGNHSSTHPSFPSLSRAKMAKEIEGVDNYLRVNFGYTSPYFRFPAGEYSDNALELVQSIGYQSVFWSVAYADWDTSVVKGCDYATTTVCSRLHKGAIILLHAVSADNTAAMGTIIDKARESGYIFCSL